jgi:hypothetical protein
MEYTSGLVKGWGCIVLRSWIWYSSSFFILVQYKNISIFTYAYTLISYILWVGQHLFLIS